MPGISGVAFLQRIRVEFPDTVRMLITGYADIDAVVQSINSSSISYYFNKPYDETDMRMILDTTIEKIKLVQENHSLLDRLKSLVSELTVQKEDLEKEIEMRKEVEKELNVAREQAEESSRLKSSLLANLNHEFRTPMNSILGFSGMIRESSEDDDIKTMAGMINISGKRLLKTLTAIIELARFEADKHIPDLEMINLSEVSQKISGDFCEAARKKNLNLSCRIKEDVHILFNISFANLIITNLIDNAIKFTNEGDVEIAVEYKSADGTQFAEFRVRDTGIGISSENHQKIFEEFLQLSEGYGRSYEGLGIGLSLSKKFSAV